jgi:uncharacterized damage-inducible protein DinB
MQQINWFQRKFDFSYDQNIYPSIRERLIGTALRLEYKLRDIEPTRLDIQIGGAWSVKENIGHLIDLEPLWQGRIQDILDGQTYLRTTDLENKATHEAGHNSKSLATLITDFDTVRLATLIKLSDITEDQLYRSALHPRLQQPQRIMDICLFVAEHDDHHLARMTEILSSI